MTKTLRHVFILSALVYFLQGIEGLPGQAFFYYMKETLGLDEARIMFLMSFVTLAWLIKPVIGYLIDTTGIPKKTWMIISALGSIGVSLVLGISAVFPLVVTLLCLGVMNWNTAVRDVANDGVMCIVGKENNCTGKIQSIQWTAITIASILTGVGGGFLAEHFSYNQIYLMLIPFYALVLFGICNWKETEVPKLNFPSFIEQMKTLLADKNLLFVSLFIFLFNFAPSFGTPLTFIMRDEWHWSKTWIGTLGTIGSAMSILGAFIYYKTSKKLNLKVCLTWSVFIGVITTLAYLYFTPVSAVVYDIITSVIGMFVQLLLLDFMARNTKSGMEATSFALLCSVNNMAGTADSLTGAWLYPILGLKGLIIISALCSFLCLPLIKHLNAGEKNA